VTATAPRTVRPVLLEQDWRDVAFLHWAVAPGSVAALLPAGTRPDELGGRTFVGLVALHMARTAALGGPTLPWPGSFGQVNVRLYSVDERGRRGVVFRSLTAGRRLPALAGRAAGLPYAWADVRVAREGNRRTYRVATRRPASIELRVGPPAENGPLEEFLTARWGLHHRAAGRTRYTAVEHGPWELSTADLVRCDTALLSAAGLPPSTGQPVSVLFSPGMDRVRIGPPA
jgi:uncharacterized protein YqjF (DUF2071 family)